MDSELPIEPGAFEPALGRPAPPSFDSPFPQERTRPLRRRVGGAVAGAGALVAKFASTVKGGVLLLPKLKLLTTAGTALVSVAAYSLFWGWSFAAGFVVLLFVHEMGHVVQLRREGIKASSPMFIPFLGAVIASRSLGENAVAEARVGLAGPVLGSLGAAACLVAAEATGSRFLFALAYVGFLINLFNLIPVTPLDGGRAMAAMAPALWFVGFAAIVATAFVVPNPFMIVIIVFAGLDLYRRWQHRRSRTLQSAAYYRVSPRARAAVAVVYVGLIVLLALGMDTAYIARTIS
jgi:Zn-dependent protease